MRIRSEGQEQEFDCIRAGRTVTELTDEEVFLAGSRVGVLD